MKTLIVLLLLCISAVAYPVFPYSIVPGGIHSVSQLRRIHDPQALALYKGFDFSHAHVAVLNSYAYVSFRKHGRVAWTTKKLRLKNQRVFTDGKIFILQRCGNTLSITPQEPTLPINPTVLNYPIPAPIPPAHDIPYSKAIIPALPVAPLPPTRRAVVPVMPEYPPFQNLPITVAGFPQAPKTPTQVPEPSGRWDAASVIGLIVFAFVYKEKNLSA